MSLTVGTSGYTYLWWGNNGHPRVINFYNTKSADSHFQQYVKYFSSVEICCTAYRRLTVKMCEKWFRMSPNDFVFTIKVPQYITNYKKLNEFQEWWDEFYPAIKALKHKLGVLLFLFCGKFHKTPENLKRLSVVKQIVPTELKCAFEFRHDSWYPLESQEERKEEKGEGEEKEVKDDLFTDNWVMSIHHTTGSKFGNLKSGFHISDTSRSNFVYIRLHGTTAFSHGAYGYEQIKDILETFTQEGKPVYMYSNATDSWEYFEFKKASLNDYKRHIPNVEYQMILAMHGKALQIADRQMVPSAVYDMLIAQKIHKERES